MIVFCFGYGDNRDNAFQDYRDDAHTVVSDPDSTEHTHGMHDRPSLDLQRATACK